MVIGFALGRIPAYSHYGQQPGLDWDGLSSVMHRHGVTAIAEFCDGIQHQVTTSTLFTGTRWEELQAHGLYQDTHSEPERSYTLGLAGAWTEPHGIGIGFALGLGRERE